MSKPYNKLNIGDIVSLANPSHPHRMVGKVTDPKGNSDGSKFRITYRLPIRFAGSKMPRWYDDSECSEATEEECKRYFKDVLRHG